MQQKTFGERLFWARRSLTKLTQKQLSDRMAAEYGVEIGRNYISQIETDEGARPSFDVARAAAGVLRISLDYLAGFTESPALVPGDEITPPHYFSQEADEVAQLVDSMRPEQRAAVVSVARTIAATTARHMARTEIDETLDSVERNFGRDERLRLELLIASKRPPLDPTA